MAFDYGLANFDIRNVFHFSGGYELPFGRGKRFMSDASGFMEQGWLGDGASSGSPLCKTVSP